MNSLFFLLERATGSRSPHPRKQSQHEPPHFSLPPPLLSTWKAFQFETMLLSTSARTLRTIIVPSGRRSSSQLTATCSSPHFFNSVMPEGATIPAFRLLDTEGQISSQVGQEWRDKVAAIEPHVLEKLMKTMSQLPILASLWDRVLLSCQGR